MGLLTLSPGSNGGGLSLGIILLGVLILLMTLGLFDTHIGKMVLIGILVVAGLAILAFAFNNSRTQNKSKDQDKELYF